MDELLTCCKSEFKNAQEVVVSVRQPGASAARLASREAEAALKPREVVAEPRALGASEPQRMPVIRPIAGRTSIDGFEGRSSEKTWLTSILRNKIVDHLRKLGREQPLSPSQDQEWQLDHFFHENGEWEEKPERWGNTPEQILRQKEFWLVFMRCLSDLSERLRTAFSLREMEGLGCDDICKILGISPSNCWTMLYRARMLLRRCLQESWFGGKNVSLDV